MTHPLPQPEGKARRGIYAAAISPLDRDGGLDAPKLATYCQYLLSNAGGCDGVAPLGTTGEGTSLSLRERQGAPDALAAVGIKPEQVILGTGTPSVDDTAMLCRSALDAGFPNVLVLPPYYYKAPSDEGLFASYARLIEKVGDTRLRLYLYHFPQMSAVPLSVSLVQRLRATFGPVIAGLKDSSGDFAQSAAFIEATGGIASDFDVFPSSEAMLWDELSIGSAGVISGSTNAFGALAQAALRAEEGPEREAAMARVTAAREVAQEFNMMAAMKQIEAWRSEDESWTRLAPPLQPLKTEDQIKLKAKLDALGV